MYPKTPGIPPRDCLCQRPFFLGGGGGCYICTECIYVWGNIHCDWNINMASCSKSTIVAVKISMKYNKYKVVRLVGITKVSTPWQIKKVFWIRPVNSCGTNKTAVLGNFGCWGWTIYGGLSIGFDIVFHWLGLAWGIDLSEAVSSVAAQTLYSIDWVWLEGLIFQKLLVQ